jgi:hypothetical protein
MNEPHDDKGHFTIPERFDDLFGNMDRLVERVTGLLIKARKLVSFHQRVEDHLMDSLIEIVALGGPAGEVAAEALIVAWPQAGWDDNIHVMLTDYASKISPSQWEARKRAGDLNWPHTHQGLDGWVAACDQDRIVFPVRHDDNE